MLFALTMSAATAWTAGLIGTMAGPVRAAWAQDRAHLADLAAAQTAARTGTPHTPTSTRSQALQARNNPDTTPEAAVAQDLDARSPEDTGTVAAA